MPTGRRLLRFNHLLFAATMANSIPHGSTDNLLHCLSQGKKVLLVGFPGGPVCEQKHLPGYMAAVSLATLCSFK